MFKNKASVLWILLLLLIVPNAFGEIVAYDFSAPQFLLRQSTPFFNTPPNIGPSTFLASFTANTSSHCCPAISRIETAG